VVLEEEEEEGGDLIETNLKQVIGSVHRVRTKIGRKGTRVIVVEIQSLIIISKKNFFFFLCCRPVELGIGNNAPLGNDNYYGGGNRHSDGGGRYSYDPQDFDREKERNERNKRKNTY
jgi:hypothetical protein